MKLVNRLSQVWLSSQCFDVFVGGGGDQLPGRTLALTPSKRCVSGQLKLPSSLVTGTRQQMRFRIQGWRPSCPPARLHCDLANMRRRYGWRRNRANQFVECVRCVRPEQASKLPFASPVMTTGACNEYKLSPPGQYVQGKSRLSFTRLYLGRRKSL